MILNLPFNLPASGIVVGIPLLIDNFMLSRVFENVSKAEAIVWILENCAV